MMFYGVIIFKKMMLRGGGRRGGGHRAGGRRSGFGGRGGMFEDVLPQHLGLHFYGAVGLPLDDRMRKAVPNIIIFFPSFHIFFTTHE
jgi:hypothetical protein